MVQGGSTKMGIFILFYIFLANDNNGPNPSTPVSKKKTITKLDDLLCTFPNTPLIPCETALNLLKIQSSEY